MQRYNSLFIRTWSRINVLERETKLFGEKHTLFSSLILPQVSLGHWLSGRLKGCCISALIVNTTVFVYLWASHLICQGLHFHVLIIMKPLITVFQNTSHTFPFDHHNSPVRYAWQILLSSFDWWGNRNSEVKWLAQGHKTNKCPNCILWFRFYNRSSCHQMLSSSCLWNGDYNDLLLMLILRIWNINENKAFCKSSIEIKANILCIISRCD